jgi:hypothetical protein
LRKDGFCRRSASGQTGDCQQRSHDGDEDGGSAPEVFAPLRSFLRMFDMFEDVAGFHCAQGYPR